MSYVFFELNKYNTDDSGVHGSATEMYSLRNEI